MSPRVAYAVSTVLMGSQRALMKRNGSSASTGSRVCGWSLIKAGRPRTQAHVVVAGERIEAVSYPRDWRQLLLPGDVIVVGLVVVVDWGSFARPRGTSDSMSLQIRTEADQWLDSVAR